METLNLNSTKSFVPPVYYRLSAVGENQFSYVYYNVRHPGAIFSIHFSDTMKAFNDLSLLVNNTQASGDTLSDEQIKTIQLATINFLFQLMNYFDCGYEIFLCFCGKSPKPSPDKYLYKWFEENEYPEVKCYFINTKATIGIYRHFFNALKHSSNRIAIFQILNPDNRKMLGLYLEGVNDRGVIGPVLDFHPMFDDMYTAWSYNFHLRIFYYLIYKIGIEIDNIVRSLCDKHSLSLLPNVPMNPTGLEKLGSDAFSVSGRCFNDRGFFYPQEIGQLTKKVNLDLVRGLLIFDDFYPDKTIDQKSRKILATTGDGFSRSFSILFTKGNEK